MKYAAVAVISVAIAFFLVRSCTPAPVRPYSIDSLTRANVALSLAFDSLQVVDSLIRVRESVVQDSFKREIRTREVKIRKLKANPTVLMVRDSFPVVDTLIREQDTTVLTLKAQVDTLTRDRIQAELRWEEQESNLQTRNKNLQGINSSLEAFNKEQAKTIKRKTWEVWLWRGITGGAIVWGLSK